MTLDINLDCMDEAELRNLASVFGLLQSYALQKAQAQYWRGRGDITLALLAEEKLDKLYEEIPEAYRW